MVDQNKNDIAYCMIDVDGKVSEQTIDVLTKTEGVIKVRQIEA
jgi:D-3-phosphoglycerate dehydrogenase / 2-oxoglutarate reductase